MTITIDNGTVGDIPGLLSQIPEMIGSLSREDLLKRIANKDSLILIAKHDDIPVGFKIGYALSQNEFYSWLGVVIPAYRNQGIASMLLKEQESWARNKTYSTLHVKSMNRYASMIRLLLSNGYQICGYEDKGSLEESKILFIKYLI